MMRRIALWTGLAMLIANGQTSTNSTSTDTWVSTPRALTVPNLEQFIDLDNAVLYKSGAEGLIRALIGAAPGNTYFVIHVLRWSDTGSASRQNWYVYHSGVWTDTQFSSQNRIYGRRRICFLYIHLNVPATAPSEITYTIQTAKKLPVYLDHLQTAGTLFGVQTAALATAMGASQNVWDAKQLEIPYLPSDLTFTPKFAGGVASTFDNEGLYRVDFSAGVQLNKTQQQQIFGLIDFYFKPIDIKSSGFSPWPHLVAGVRAGNRPLKRILVGIGYGPAIAHVYGGIVYDSTTSPAHRELSFGLNISIGAALSTLQK